MAITPACLYRLLSILDPPLNQNQSIKHIRTIKSSRHMAHQNEERHAHSHELMSFRWL